MKGRALANSANAMMRDERDMEQRERKDKEEARTKVDTDPSKPWYYTCIPLHINHICCTPIIGDKSKFLLHTLSFRDEEGCGLAMCGWGGWGAV